VGNLNGLTTTEAEEIIERWLVMLERGSCVEIRNFELLRELSKNLKWLGMEYKVYQIRSLELGLVWIVCPKRR